MHYVPWFCASFSSLNWVTCWWSLDSFEVPQPCLASDVGDWQGEELTDDRTGCQQEEDNASDLYPAVKSSIFLAEVLK